MAPFAEFDWTPGIVLWIIGVFAVILLVALTRGRRRRERVRHRYWDRHVDSNFRVR